MMLLYGEHDGKTRELIKRSSETGTVIVCYNSRRAEFVRCYAETMGMDIQKPISISDLQKGPHHGKILIGGPGCVPGNARHARLRGH